MNNVTLWKKTEQGWELVEEIPHPLPKMYPRRIILSDFNNLFICEVEIEGDEDTSVEN
jgi:hypothetical protein